MIIIASSIFVLKPNCSTKRGDGINTCEHCGRTISNGGFGGMGMCEDCFNDFADWLDKKN